MKEEDVRRPRGPLPGHRLSLVDLSHAFDEECSADAQAEDGVPTPLLPGGASRARPNPDLPEHRRRVTTGAYYRPAEWQRCWLSPACHAAVRGCGIRYPMS
jgi:hypothetical protein